MTDICRDRNTHSQLMQYALYSEHEHVELHTVSNQLTHMYATHMCNLQKVLLAPRTLVQLLLFLYTVPNTPYNTQTVFFSLLSLMTPRRRTGGGGRTNAITW